MEIVTQVIEILAFILMLKVVISSPGQDDIARLQDQIGDLNKLNKFVYKDLTEEYRKLIKASDNVKHRTFGVEFNPHIQGDSNEYILYKDLENKIAEVKKLKARLCDNNCTSSLIGGKDIRLFDGSISVSYLDNVDEKDLKKPRKQRKKK